MRRECCLLTWYHLLVGLVMLILHISMLLLACLISGTCEYLSQRCKRGVTAMAKIDDQLKGDLKRLQRDQVRLALRVLGNGAMSGKDHREARATMLRISGSVLADLETLVTEYREGRADEEEIAARLVP